MENDQTGQWPLVSCKMPAVTCRMWVSLSTALLKLAFIGASPALVNSGRQLRPDMPALNSALTALGRAGRWREAGAGQSLHIPFCLLPKSRSACDMPKT